MSDTKRHPTGRRHRRRAALLTLAAVALMSSVLPSTAGGVETDAEQSEGPSATVVSFGDGTAVALPAVDRAVALDATGAGTVAVTADGLVSTTGGVPHLGDVGHLLLGAPIVDVALTPSGLGYWLLASDGGVFTFGDAGYLGSVPEVLGGTPLDRPVTAMVPTASGGGYWLFASDGGVFAFGDAPYLGSLPQVLGPGRSLDGSIVGAAAPAGGGGYWLVGRDGGVFTFGDIAFHGSAAPEGRDDIVDIAAVGDGYAILVGDGLVRTYGVAHLGNADGASVSIAGSADSYVVLRATLTPVERGERSPAVAALQHELSTLGYWTGSVDGSYGHLTSQAVMAFQKWEGLPRTGAADAATIAALLVAERPEPASTAGDLIEIDLDRQLLFVVRGGEVQYTFNTSTGSGVPYEREGRWYHARTPTGRYDVYFERPVGWRISPLGRLWRPKYFNGGIAVHGSGFIPGYPDSHGCARLSVAAMDFFYDADLMPMGSEVWVY